MKVGSKVRFTDADAHKEEPCFYPPVGTVGIVVGISRDGFLPLYIQWPKGATSDDGLWWAAEEWVEEVQQ